MPHLFFVLLLMNLAIFGFYQFSPSSLPSPETEAYAEGVIKIQTSNLSRIN